MPARPDFEGGFTSRSEYDPGVAGFGPLSRVLRAPVVSWFVRQKLVLFMARIKSNDLIALKEPIEVGRTPPVIDRRYARREVSEATRYLKEGHARGKVVITVGSRAQA